MKFYNLLLVALLAVAPGVAWGQKYDLDLDAMMLKKNGPFKKGDTIHLKAIIHDIVEDKFTQDNTGDVFLLVNDKDEAVEVSGKVEDCFKFYCRRIQDIWNVGYIMNVLNFMQKKGRQCELRNEMEKDALTFLNEVSKYDLAFEAPFLESYIYSLIDKVKPQKWIYRGNSDLNVLLLKDVVPNIKAYPNGTIAITTGLLSILHSEDELVALLAREIAHIAFDHTVMNVVKEVTRQNRAAFWSGLLTGLSAVAEGVIASKNDYYIPGFVTLGVAALTSSISDQVIDRLGMNYEYEQINEASNASNDILYLLGYDVNALASVERRIEKYSLPTYHTDQDFFADTSRDIYGGEWEPKPIVGADREFERRVSAAVTYSAYGYFVERHYRQCIAMVSQNIVNGVAMEDDYLLKVRCMLALSDSEESNNEALRLLWCAKQVNANNINIYKCEILVLLRLHRREDALMKLEEYKSVLYSDAVNFNDFIADERAWVRSMLIKLKAMS